MSVDPKSESIANVSRFLDSMAAAQGDRPALMVPTGRDGAGRIVYLTLSFEELAVEQDAWGIYLKGRGISRGDRVLLMARPGLPLIALSFALFKISMGNSTEIVTRRTITHHVSNKHLTPNNTTVNKQISYFIYWLG